MNPWPFVIAAYAVTIVADRGAARCGRTRSMRRAEAAADALKRK